MRTGGLYVDMVGSTFRPPLRLDESLSDLESPGSSGAFLWAMKDRRANCARFGRLRLGWARLYRHQSSGGQGGIRTHEGLAPLPVFKTGAFNRSATLPVMVGLGGIEPPTSRL